MLDRLSDSFAQNWDAFEPLPPRWQPILEALQSALSRADDERAYLTVALERTATELREQLVELDALRRARSVAESTNLVRGQILATVSCSMRRPSDALLGLARLLRQGPLLPAQRDYVEALHGSAQELRGILNQVSDFSRLESGTLPLEPIPFELRLMVEDLAATLGEEALLRGISLRVEWQAGSPTRVLGDPGRIRQLLTALIRDGFARLSHGDVLLGVALITARGKPSGIVVSVEDSGPAIPEALLTTLFEPFAQGDANSDRERGLDLPIARELAHLMGGELQAENPARGGTRFTLHLPLQSLDDSWPASVLALPPAPGTAPAPGGELLVMEADARQRTTWTGIAEAAGYQVATCASREEILAELAHRAQQGRGVDIVICSDHDAEAYDGLGREIIADGGLSKPALVMLPGVGNPGDARRLMEAGFRGYLVKPVAPADLREILETLRRTPRSEWHTLFLTRHSLAEGRLGERRGEGEGEGEEETVDAGLTGLLET